MENKTYDYNYIPSYIVRNWAGKDDRVKFNTSFETKTYVSPVDEMYIERLSNNRNLDPECANYLKFKPLVEDVMRLSHGDTATFSNDLFNIAVLFLFIYNTNPYGYGRFASLMVDEVSRMDSAQLLESDASGLSEKVRGRLSETRDVEELLKKQSEAFLMASYILDLKSVLVEAAGTGFLLSSSPLFFGNPYNKAAFNDIVEPYTRRGAVFFMPISPKLTVCLYDGDIYKVNKTEDRVLLSKEDTLLINSYIINVADDVCYTSTDEEYFSFKEKFFSGVYDCCSFDPSFLKVKNKLPSEMDEKRELPQLMESYDNEQFKSLGDAKEVPPEFYRKRMEYAYSIVAGRV